MHWNHRIVRKRQAGETILMFAEVYYREGKAKPYAYNEPFMHGDDIAELRELAQRLRTAVEQPILDHDDFDWDAYEEGEP